MKKICIDYTKLRSEIKKKYGSLYNYAKAANMSYFLLLKKIFRQQYFSHDEIKIALNLLNIKNSKEYFYKLK